MIHNLAQRILSDKHNFEIYMADTDSGRVYFSFVLIDGIQFNLYLTDKCTKFEVDMWRGLHYFSAQYNVDASGNLAFVSGDKSLLDAFKGERGEELQAFVVACINYV
jgi:hypothetical protein